MVLHTIRSESSSSDSDAVGAVLCRGYTTTQFTASRTQLLSRLRSILLLLFLCSHGIMCAVLSAGQNVCIFENLIAMPKQSSNQYNLIPGTFYCLAFWLVICCRPSIWQLHSVRRHHLIVIIILRTICQRNKDYTHFVWKFVSCDKNNKNKIKTHI